MVIMTGLLPICHTRREALMNGPTRGTDEWRFLPAARVYISELILLSFYLPIWSFTFSRVFQPRIA